MRESLLGAEQPSIIINEKINTFDNSAIEILRIIESKRTSITKCKDSWDKVLQEGSMKMREIIPGLTSVLSNLEKAESSIIRAKIIFEDCVIEQNENEYSMALQYKSKLIELLNKY